MLDEKDLQAIDQLMAHRMNIMPSPSGRIVGS